MTGEKNWEHLTDELAILNARLLLEFRRRNNASHPDQLDALRGLVLNESEIIAILSENPLPGITDRCDGELERKLREIEERVSRRRLGELRGSLPLVQITAFFGLERIEEQCLVLCLAPEIDREYSKVFAFLHDDLTKKQPSVDLALRLFCGDTPERMAARAIFSPHSALIRNRLVRLEDTFDGQLALTQQSLKLDDRIAAFLLGTAQLDARLCEWVEFVAPSAEPVQTAVPAELRERTLCVVERCFSQGEASVRPVIHLYGRDGSGRRALAKCASQVIGLPLLAANLRRLPSSATERAEALWRLGREALLQPAAVLIENFDELLPEASFAELATLMEAIEAFSPLTFLSGRKAWRGPNSGQFFASLECPVPDATARIGFWKKWLEGTPNELGDDDLVELASKFSFTDGQIRDALRAACDRSGWESHPLQPLTPALLNQACRGVATPNLSGLARKIEPCHSWSDIVLQENQLAQLHEIATHVKRAQTVFEAWGFDKKFPYGKGIAALFEGQSGTGKTMAAGIIAGAIGLDLYKIDLSTVVSKYIGETEKNLNRIFAEAEDGKAILFFDEADALFGKRSEVKDAHDRYANIETAYLLQRMEEYGGVVILASNMKQNMDEAFVRRMRFIVHFSFPTDEQRELIWRKAFPAAAPLGGDVDFRWLARKLKITGGNIKNISLRSAFLAIDRQGVVDMNCLLEAAKREIEKIGKIFAVAEFRAPAPVAEAIKIAEVA